MVEVEVGVVVEVGVGVEVGVVVVVEVGVGVGVGVVVEVEVVVVVEVGVVVVVVVVVVVEVEVVVGVEVVVAMSSKQLDFALIGEPGTELFRSPDNRRYELARQRLRYALERIGDYWGSEYLAAQLGRAPGTIRSAITGAPRHGFRIVRDLPVLLRHDESHYLVSAINACVEPLDDGDVLIAMGRAALKMYGQRGHEELLRATQSELATIRTRKAK